MSHLDAREVLIKGHDIESKIQNSNFVNYGVVRVTKNRIQEKPNLMLLVVQAVMIIIYQGINNK